MHSLELNHVKASYEKKLSDQQNSLIAACSSDKQLMENSSNDFQNQIHLLDASINDLNSVRGPGSCIAVMPDFASGYSLSPGAVQPFGQGFSGGFISRSQYVKFLAEGERYRLQVAAVAKWKSAIAGDPKRK